MVDDRTVLMSPSALRPGYEILWYTVERVLGQGGFGITYLAHDRNLERPVAIKEYLPSSFAFRHHDHTVNPITNEHKEKFVWGLASFLREAQTLARFSHPNIVRVNSVFEHNNTAYMVMEYEHGQNLAAIYKTEVRPGQQFFEQVFFPIIDGLKKIHQFEFIHRDIKPANIFLRKDGTPVLIDFGSARQTTGQQTSEITALVSQGYTPIEQYSANYGDQGPWTDIYAMAATMYQGVVGVKPEDSLSRSARVMRSTPDLLERPESSRYPEFSQRFLDAVFAGLELDPEDRPQSLEQWFRLFSDGEPAWTPGNSGHGFTALESDESRVLADWPDATDTTVATGEVTAPLTEPHADAGRLDKVKPRSFDAQWDPQNDWPQGSLGQGQSAPVEGLSPPLAADDPFDFNDAEFSRIPGAEIAERRTPAARRVKRHKGRPRRRTGLLALLGIAVVVAAGLLVYLFSASRNAGDALTVSKLASMPGPQQSVEMILPATLVLSQLADMQSLASLVTQAYALDTTDPDLLAIIRDTEENLIAIARKWNATRHVEVANAILAVSGALPAAVHDRDRIRRLLAAADQVSHYEQIIALIDNGQYLLPAQESVLDRIGAVSAAEFNRLRQTPQWTAMMGDLSQMAVDRLAGSQFDDAARLTEAALTIDPQHAGFNALYSFLQ